MLTLLGFGMVIAFMFLIMTKRLSPLVALIAIPILFAIIGGFGGRAVGDMMIEGVRSLAPTGVMLMFAILYFGIMTDAGLFDPIVRCILRVVGNDPMKAVVGTAVLAAVISLDGDGSTTYMIVVASMLPLYRRLGLDVLNLTCVTMLASGVMNLTPWGGPLARAASALHVEPAEVFVPMIPAMIVGVLGVIALAYLLGLRERRRLGFLSVDRGDLQPVAVVESGSRGTTSAVFSVVSGDADLSEAPSSSRGGDTRQAGRCAEHSGLPAQNPLRRPKLLWVNAALTAVLMISLVIGVLPLSVLFMIAFAIAIVVNYPNLEEQRSRIGDHAKNVISVVSLIFAAGIFTGILSGTGMVNAMADSLLASIPADLGPFLAPITALASMPFTFFISNDAFYFGVMPIASEAAAAYGISPVEMARASLVGQPVHLLSPLVPSTYLLVGLVGVEFGDHQRYTLKWACLISLVIMATALTCGAFPMLAG